MEELGAMGLGLGAMGAAGLENGEENGGNKDGQSELETGKGVGEMWTTGLGT